MAALADSLVDDEEWLKPSPLQTHRDSASVRPYKRKLVRLDDLLVDSEIQKAAKLERESRRAKVLFSEEEDDESEDLGHENEMSEFIETCSKEVGDGSDLKEIPRWGERVFGLKKEAPVCSLAGTEIPMIKSLQAAEENYEDVMLDLLTGNWALSIMRGHFDPTFCRWLFNKMAYSEDSSVERAACRVLCKSLSLHKETYSPIWLPTLKDVMETLNVYGYTDSSNQIQVTAGNTQSIPQNIVSVLQYVRCCCNERELNIFNCAEAKELLYVLARCCVDRQTTPFSYFFQDCMESLINFFSDTDWASSARSIASTLARTSTELVNNLHVLSMLRGVPDRIQCLHSEMALELLSSIRKHTVRRDARDVLSGLQSVDLKAKGVDFFQLYHHVNLVDIWLRQDVEFRKDKDTEELWMSILRNFSVRIYGGDYRTYATKVRNRAAYLQSNYHSDDCLNFMDKL